MSVDHAPSNYDALRSALESARKDLLTSFYAKQAADRRYMEAFAAYERIADTLRGTLTIAATEPQKPAS